VLAIECDKMGREMCVVFFVKFHFNFYKQVWQFTNIGGNYVAVFIFGFWFDRVRLEGNIILGQFVDEFLFDISDYSAITTTYVLEGWPNRLHNLKD
jgi:hypothetical protein